MLLTDLEICHEVQILATDSSAGMSFLLLWLLESLERRGCEDDGGEDAPVQADVDGGRERGICDEVQQVDENMRATADRVILLGNSNSLTRPLSTITMCRRLSHRPGGRLAAAGGVHHDLRGQLLHEGCGAPVIPSCAAAGAGARVINGEAARGGVGTAQEPVMIVEVDCHKDLGGTGNLGGVEGSAVFLGLVGQGAEHMAADVDAVRPPHGRQDLSYGGYDGVVVHGLLTQEPIAFNIAHEALPRVVPCIAAVLILAAGAAGIGAGASNMLGRTLLRFILAVSA